MWNNEKAKKLIKKEGIRRKDLAEYCGIELHSLNNVLSGSHKPSRPVLLLMAQRLRTTLEELDPEHARAG